MKVAICNIGKILSGDIAAPIAAGDTIILDDGKIVARGTHAELIRQHGVYSDLYRTQLDTEFEVVEERAG